MDKWILATIQTFMVGKKAKKDGRNQTNTWGMICLQQNHIQVQIMGNNENYRDGYNVAFPKVELPAFNGENP
jgi:hypothetical protein